jgi:hypothetical protein
MRILIERSDAFAVKQRRAALDPVNDLTLLQQEFGDMGAVLSSHSSNEGNLLGHETSILGPETPGA